MHDLAGEFARDIGDARNVMVAAGDDERAIEQGAGGAGDVDEPAGVGALVVFLSGVELDAVENAAGLGLVA
jgi:hypothetical protein